MNLIKTLSKTKLQLTKKNIIIAIIVTIMIAITWLYGVYQICYPAKEIADNSCSPEMNLYPKIYTTTYKGKILYKVEQCRWERTFLDGTTEYSWQIGVEPTEDKDLAIKKFYEYSREFIKRVDDENIRGLDWLEIDGEGRFLMEIK